MAEGYVIIKHQIFGEITDAEVLEQLPKSGATPIYKIFDIKREIIPMENVHQLDSVEYRIYQKNVIDTEIKPFLRAHPDYKVLYFGTATIPIALHLGYCFGSWKDVDVYLLHREKMKWNWSDDDENAALPTDVSFVKEEFTGPLDVIYKMEATYLIVEDELKSVVESPSKIISVKLETIGKDVFRNQEQLKAFAHQFSLGIDSISNYLPNVDKIHLFPTVPVGLAFLMGTKINPLITKPIVTYQFNARNTPKHEKILILQETGQREANITEDDQKLIDQIKVSLKEELANKIAVYSATKMEEKAKYKPSVNWIQLVLPGGKYDEMERGFWKSVKDIADTVLGSSTFSMATDKANDGFYISEQNEWQIQDRFIFNIINRLDRDQNKILRALRMFIFHEAIHVHQRLTNYTATNIGRFPRVLEEVDYVADVWAMIHEFAFSKTYYNAETKDEKTFFMHMINIASKTMWAFDDLDPNTEEMQIRRVNRYLFWYWNYLMIEDRSCKNLEDIVAILANKPLLEIRGLDIRAQSQRTIFRLNGFKIEDLEMAYLDINGQIRRASNAAGFQINEVVKGFIERDGQKILDQLKSWYHQIRN
jgi:hypothetical protein